MNCRLPFGLRWGLLPGVMALAWPTMVEQLLQTVVQYIDTAMVGQLGTHATAAVGGTGTIAWLINGTISAISIGFLAYIAQARGAGDDKGLEKPPRRHCFAHCLWVCFSLS